MKKTIKGWAVFVKGKIKHFYEDEQEAKFSADIEKYMGLETKSKKRLAAYIKLIKIRRITISWEE